MANIDERICIIGGGPAGISAAMYLQFKGYRNYRIYEKLNKVGGKSYSPKIMVNGEERSFETGAIMGAITYHAVHEVEKFGGVGHYDGPNMRRMYRDSSGQESYPFDIKKNPSLKKTRDMTATDTAELPRENTRDSPRDLMMHCCRLKASTRI